MILVCILIVSLIGIGYFGYQEHNAKSKIESLQKESETLVDEGSSNSQNIDKDASKSDFQSKNEDYVGWLKIGNSEVNYPVVQTNNNSYYLKHDFYKENSRYGCPFLDSDCTEESFNLIIYAHHFRYDTHTMFGPLEKMYKRENDSLNYQNLSFNGEKYKVVGSFYNNSDEILPNKCGYAYNTVINDANMYEYYIEGINKKLQYKDNELTSNDKVLLLSTCSYGNNDQRFVVVFKEI